MARYRMSSSAYGIFSHVHGTASYVLVFFRMFWYVVVFLGMFSLFFGLFSYFGKFGPNRKKIPSMKIPEAL